MLIRALSLSLVLLAGPASPWVPAPCCAASDECCTGDAPTCPVTPAGECSLSAAHEALAIAGAGLAQADAPQGSSIPTVSGVAATPCAAFPTLHAPSPPPYLLQHAFRN